MRVNQQVTFNVLKTMIREGALSSDAAEFLGLGGHRFGSISFGPESSAQTSICDNIEWPKPENYWYKDYDYPKEKFVEPGKELMKQMKAKMKIAIQNAGSTEDFGAINTILEQGLPIMRRNKRVLQDDRRGFRLLDNSITGRDSSDLYLKEWGGNKYKMVV